MSVNYSFIFDMSEILDNIYVWVVLVISESVLLLAFVKYMLYSHCTENTEKYFFFFGTFWRLKTLILWRKIVQNLLVCVYLFYPKNSNCSITQERLVLESCSTPRWIAFLMLYWFVYNIRSDFNELILVWSAYK